MNDFVKAENVLVNQNEASREAVLQAIARKAEQLGITDDSAAVYKAFLAREDLGETGMTDGFAVPHAKDDAIKEPAIVVFKNQQPLEWPSFDEKPVDIAIALLVPEHQAGTTHIKLLSKTAVMLMKPDFRKAIRESDDSQTIADAINEGIED